MLPSAEEGGQVSVSPFCEKSTFDPPLAVIAVNSLNSLSLLRSSLLPKHCVTRRQPCIRYAGGGRRKGLIEEE